MSSPQRFCHECGAVLAVAAKFCSRCGTPATSLAARAAEIQAVPPDWEARPAALSLAHRRAILQAEIGRYELAGYRAVAQTDTTVQLVKPKSFSRLLAGVLRLLWSVAKKNDQVYLEIGERGQVLGNGQRPPSGAQPVPADVTLRLGPAAVMLRLGRVTCPACGHPNGPHRASCRRCGTRLPGS